MTMGSNNRVFHCLGGDQYNGVVTMFKKRGWIYSPVMLDAEVLVLTGGADITPFLYGERMHKTTKPNFKRDLFEVRELKKFPISKPKIGICRGAQLLNVQSGGSLFQHVTGHTSNHNIYDLQTGSLVYCTSTHHQMMIPSDNAEVIATAGTAVSKESIGYSFKTTISEDPEEWDDPELVWYEDTKSFCFQGHPEYNINATCDYFFEKLDQIVVPSIRRTM